MWGTPMPAEKVVRVAATDEDRDEMRQHLEAVLDLPSVSRGPDGVYIPNGQETHIQAANWLRENTDRSALVIASTLSRLPPDWPTNGQNGT
jgi:hypothetical protein